MSLLQHHGGKRQGDCVNFNRITNRWQPRPPPLCTCWMCVGYVCSSCARMPMLFVTMGGTVRAGEAAAGVQVLYRSHAVGRQQGPDHGLLGCPGSMSQNRKQSCSCFTVLRCVPPKTSKDHVVSQPQLRPGEACAKILLCCTNPETNLSCVKYQVRNRNHLVFAWLPSCCLFLLHGNWSRSQLRFGK